jgi:hypothetical protein
MFIIVSGYRDTLANKDLSIEMRMKRTLMTSGLAIKEKTTHAKKRECDGGRLGLWCLTSLSTIFQ